MIRFVLVSMIDITEQVLARRELERLDIIKDDFLSLTTHELRSPLTAIMGNAQILQRGMKRMARQLGDEDKQREQIEQWVNVLDKVVGQTNKINSLLSEMRDVTRLSGNVFELHMSENVDIVALIQRVIEQYTMVDGGKHPITFTPDAKIGPSSIDADRIEQVLSNLISNVLKYSPAEKSVNVSINYMKDTPGTVIITVRDEGYGIKKEEQEHIFERFYRADNRMKVDGLGLGLYIAYQIVTQHGGRMWLESEPGEGSTFYFTLPLSQQASEK